jgi:hypothetical protein
MAMSTRQAACSLSRAGWPADLIPTMVTVGKAESGLNPAAVNRDPSVATAPPTGWLQVRAFPDRTAKWDLADADQNAQAALAVYRDQGLGAWTTYPTAAAQFLPQVRQELSGWDPSQCGASVAVSGSGLMAGRQVDPWGIAQGITDAVGGTGAAVAAIGRRVESGGQLALGVLLVAGAVTLLGWLWLTRTDTGRGTVRAGRAAARATKDAAAAAIALAPK